MKGALIAIGLVVLSVGGFIFVLNSMITSSGAFTFPWFDTGEEAAYAGDDLVLASSAFDDGAAIPVSYSCFGDNVNPPLEVAGVSDETESFVLILEDLDADRDSINSVPYHWVVYNIPPWVRTIQPGSVPWSSVGRNSYGRAAYLGPCQEAIGEEREYRFTLFALDSSLGVEDGADTSEVIEAMREHVFGTASLTGTFRR